MHTNYNWVTNALNLPPNRTQWCALSTSRVFLENMRNQQSCAERQTIQQLSSVPRDTNGLNQVALSYEEFITKAGPFYRIVEHILWHVVANGLALSQNIIKAWTNYCKPVGISMQWTPDWQNPYLATDSLSIDPGISNMDRQARMIADTFPNRGEPHVVPKYYIPDYWDPQKVKGAPNLGEPQLFGSKCVRAPSVAL